MRSPAFWKSIDSSVLGIRIGRGQTTMSKHLLMALVPGLRYLLDTRGTICYDGTSYFDCSDSERKTYELRIGREAVMSDQNTLR